MNSVSYVIIKANVIPAKAGIQEIVMYHVGVIYSSSWRHIHSHLI